MTAEQSALFAVSLEPVLCRECGRKLTRSPSRELGIGPVCRTKNKEAQLVLFATAARIDDQIGAFDQ
jgi:hypothetical protein